MQCQAISLPRPIRLAAEVGDGPGGPAGGIATAAARPPATSAGVSRPAAGQPPRTCTAQDAGACRARTPRPPAQPRACAAAGTTPLPPARHPAETLTFRQGADHHGEIPSLSRSAEEVSLLGPLRPDRVVVVRQLVSWRPAARRSNFIARKSQIEGKLSLVKAIASNREHPSDELHPADPRSGKRPPDQPGGEVPPPACTTSMREANPLPRLFTDEKTRKDSRRRSKRSGGRWRRLKNSLQAQLDDVLPQSIWEPHRRTTFPSSSN